MRAAHTASSCVGTASAGSREGGMELGRALWGVALKAKQLAGSAFYAHPYNVCSHTTLALLTSRLIQKEGHLRRGAQVG